MTATGYTPKLHPFASTFGWGPVVVELINPDGSIAQERRFHTMAEALADIADTEARKGKGWSARLQEK